MGSLDRLNRGARTIDQAREVSVDLLQGETSRLLPRYFLLLFFLLLSGDNALVHEILPLSRSWCDLMAASRLLDTELPLSGGLGSVQSVNTPAPRCFILLPGCLNLYNGKGYRRNSYSYPRYNKVKQTNKQDAPLIRGCFITSPSLKAF